MPINDTSHYFIVTPGSNVVSMPGAYANLNGTDLFFYITETGSLRVVNMNSDGLTVSVNTSPGLISYSLAQNVKWMDVITMPGNALVHVYYADHTGAMFYAPYMTFGSNVTFQAISGVANAVTFSAIYSPNSNPTAFLLMVDDGIRHNLYVASNPTFATILQSEVTFNNNFNSLVLISRPSIAMHPSDTKLITVTCEQTVLLTSVTSVGFYEVKVPGLV